MTFNWFACDILDSFQPYQFLLQVENILFNKLFAVPRAVQHFASTQIFPQITNQKSFILKIITASMTISLFQNQVATLLQVKSCHADASQIQRLTHALVQKEGEIKILNAKISTLEKERVWNQNHLLKTSCHENGIVLRSVPQVQNAYFSLFYQSNCSNCAKAPQRPYAF